MDGTVKLNGGFISTQYFNNVAILSDGLPLPPDIQEALVDQVHRLILNELFRNKETKVSNIKSKLRDFYQKVADNSTNETNKEIPAIFDILWNLALVKTNALGIKIKEGEKENLVVRPDNQNDVANDDNAEMVAEEGRQAERFDSQIFEIDDYDNIKHIIKETLALMPYRLPVNKDGKIEHEVQKTMIGGIKFYDVEEIIREFRQIFKDIPNLSWEGKAENNKMQYSVKEILTELSKKPGKEHYASFFAWVESKWDQNVKNAFISSFKNFKNNIMVGYWEFKNGAYSYQFIDALRDNGGGILIQKWNSHYLNPENGFVRRNSNGTLVNTGKSKDIYNTYKELLRAIDPKSIYNFEGKDQILPQVVNFINVNRLGKELQDKIIDTIFDLYQKLGIEVNRNQVSEIILNPLEVFTMGKGRRLNYNPFSASGLLNIMFEPFGDIEDGSTISKTPIDKSSNYLKTIANYISSTSGNIYSESARDSNGGQRFAYTVFGHATNTVARIKRGDYNKKEFGVFGRDCVFLNDPHFDFNILGELSEKSSKKVAEGHKLTPLEMELSKINMIHNDGRTIRYAPTATNSDKKPFPFLTFSVDNKDLGLSKEDIISQTKPLRNSIRAETLRMEHMPSNTGDKRIDQGTKFYVITPEANISVARELFRMDINEKSIDKYLSLAGIKKENGINYMSMKNDIVDKVIEKGYIIKDERALVDVENTDFLVHLSTLIYNKNLDELKERWIELGVVEEDGGEIISHKFDKSWVKNRTNYDDSLEPIFDKAAREYLTLSNQSLLGYYQIIVGDPISSFKYAKGVSNFNKDGSVKSAADFTWQEVLDTVKVTNKEVIKRNAKNLASGKLFEFNIYNPKTKKFEVQKKYNVTVIKDDIRDSLINDLVKEHPDAYAGMTVSDAAEFATAKDFLDVEWVNNLNPEFTEKVYIRIANKLEAQSKYAWDVPMKKDDPNRLTPEEMRIVFGAQKPVQNNLISYTEDKNNPDQSIASFYCKSARFPIIHQIHVGTSLNKLGKAMEAKGIQSALFESAVKNGAIKPANLFKDGEIKIENLPKGVSEIDVIKDMLYPIELKRDGFYIQNEIPFDEAKSEILIMSQLDKLFIEHIENVDPKLKGVRNRKFAIKKAMYDRALLDLAEKFGFEVDGDRAIITNKSDFIKKLRKEAEGRGFSQNDLDLLKIGDDGELITPLIFNHAANPFESVLTSILSKVVRQKVSGQSYVQMPATGVSTIAQYGNLSDIVLLDKNRKDKTPRTIRNERGEAVAAEIYVPWRFIKGDKEINMKDYVNKDGTLKTEKIDPKLLQLIAARIPTQGFSSVLPFIVIGFLPSNRNTAIVPIEIVGQMGSDFEGSLLYAYNWNYEIKNNGKIKIIKSKPSEAMVKMNLHSLQNEYFDILWKVLTNPKVYNLITTPLENSDIQNEFDRIDNIIRIDDNISLIDPTYNSIAYIENQTSRKCIGIGSNFLVYNAILQNRGLYKIVNKNEEVQFEIDGLTLKYLAIDSKSIYTLPDATTRTRKVSENICSLLSASFDNSRFSRFKELNFNFNTLRAAFVLLMLSDYTNPYCPKSVALDYVIAFLSHPAIKDYINRKEKIFNQINEGYSRYKDIKLKESLLKQKNSNVFLLPTIQILRSGKGDTNEILNTFFALDDVGQYLSETLETINVSTHGLGESFIQSQITAKEYRNKILNGNNISLMFGFNISGLESLIDTDYAYASDRILNVLNSIGNEFFPYNKFLVKYQKYFDSQGIFISNKNWRNIINHYKAFVYSHSNLYSGNLKEIRYRLLYSEDNIFDRFDKLKKQVRKGIGDYFFNELFVDRVKNMLKYPASRQDRTDAIMGTTALLQILNSTDIELARFGKDFVAYSLLFCPIQNANNFIKFMPSSVWHSLSETLRIEEDKLKSSSIEYLNFLKQLIQNEPNYANTIFGFDFGEGESFKVPFRKDLLETADKLKNAIEKTINKNDLIKLRKDLLLVEKSLRFYILGENNLNEKLNDGTFTILAYIKLSSKKGCEINIFEAIPDENGFRYKKINLVNNSQTYIYDYSASYDISN